MISATPRHQLHGDQVPTWVYASAGPRYESWARSNPNAAPDPALVCEWAIDGSGLSSTYRGTLRVLSKLHVGDWTITFVADRVGISYGHLRDRVAPDLVSLGWLAVEGARRGSHKNRAHWTVLVPAERPLRETVPAALRRAFPRPAPTRPHRA